MTMVAAPEGALVPVAGGSEGEPMRILMIDNQPEYCALVQTMLSGSLPGSTVDRAESMAEGIKMSTTGAYLVALLGLNLPDAANAQDIIARYLGVGSRPATVVITGNNDNRLILHAMMLGAEGFLRKDKLTPFDVQFSVRMAIARRYADLVKRRHISDVLSEINTTVQDSIGHLDSVVRRVRENSARLQALSRFNESDIHKLEEALGAAAR